MTVIEMNCEITYVMSIFKIMVAPIRHQRNTIMRFHFLKKGRMSHL